MTELSHPRESYLKAAENFFNSLPESVQQSLLEHLQSTKQGPIDEEVDHALSVLQSHLKGEHSIVAQVTIWRKSTNQ